MGSKTYWLVTFGALIGGIYFYNINALVSLLCIGFFIISIWSAGRV